MKKQLILTSLILFLLAGVFANPAFASGAAEASTLQASGVTTYQATLNGAVDTGSQAVIAWFEYGLTPSYGNSTAPVVFAPGASAYPSVDVVFNGTDQNAVVPGFGAYAPTNEVTIEFWQYVVDAQQQSSFILNPDVVTNRINAHVPWLDGNIYWDFGNITGNGRVSVLANKVVGHWVNVALVATQSGNDMLIFVNGVIQAQSGSMTPFQRYAADLLLAGGVNNYFFNGAMADFRVWNKALNPSTLQAWMNQPLNPTHPYWTNLVAWWPMNEGSGSVLNDQSGNGHTATLNNAPVWQVASNSQVSATVQGLAQGRTYHYALVVSQGGQIFAGPDATFTTPAPPNLNASLPVTVLHNFTGTNDGAELFYNVVLSGRTLYGTTYVGGSNNAGTIFSVNTDGSGFTVLHTFLPSNSTNNFVNTGGAYPLAPLTVAGGTLYGTTTIGGTSGYGTLFAMNTNGSGFTTLYNFAGINDGSGPVGALLQAGNTLFGTTEFGGTNNGSGTAFSIHIDGTGYTQLHVFNAFGADGNSPQGSLLLAGGRLYGVTQVGGGGASANDTGAVFAMNTDGSGFTVVHAFGPLTFNGTFNYNSDGGDPNGGLALLNGTLYGTTFLGGVNGVGTIFAVNTSGTGFTNLHTFTAGNDGAVPGGGLLLVDNTLYGAASEAGVNGNGTIFKINPDGTGFTVLHGFSALGYNSSFIYGNADGSGPNGNLFLSGNLLYGTTFGGGTYNDGTVFTLPLGPQLAITPAGADVVLTWPANEAGFSLQSAPALAPAPTWSAVSPLPVAANGQFAVTNAAGGQKMFYRLSQ